MLKRLIKLNCEQCDFVGEIKYKLTRHNKNTKHKKKLFKDWITVHLQLLAVCSTKLVVKTYL